MISLWRIFSLEFAAFVRSKSLALLTVASVAWMVALPAMVQSDGTEAGAREICVHYSLGGVFVLLVIALISAATGSIASERTAKRLQLTLVRPVSSALVAWGKFLALVACGALVLLAASVALCATIGIDRRCSHVIGPITESIRAEAERMYADYMADPKTPEEVRKADKSVVIGLLERHALDMYRTIPAGERGSWKFPVPADTVGASVRLRFSSAFSSRQDVIGDFTLGSAVGVVSNVTQSILLVPLAGKCDGDGLEFENRGDSPLMLRTRKDIQILIPADSFTANLARAYIELVASLALVIAFGVFLGATMSRPVALFTAMAILVVGEIGPSVVERYPDELGAAIGDRVGIAVTKFVSTVTRPLSSSLPLERLSLDECVEPAEVFAAVSVNLVAVPILLSLLAGFAMTRHDD